MSRPSTVLCAFLTSAALAGCVGSPLEGASVPGPLGGTPLSLVELLDSEGFRYGQPVTVFLVGFEPGTGAKLQAALGPEEVHHMTGSFSRTVPPDTSDPELPLSFPGWGNPTIAVAEYTVVELPPEFAAAFFTKAVPVEGEEGVYDANAAETTLVADLAAAGHPLDPTVPALAVLHAGALGDHAWRHTFGHGYLQPVRAFGEREAALTIHDPSAAPDPYYTTQSAVAKAQGTPPPGKAYDYPLEAGGDATVEALHELVVDATHYRLLKGAIYPVATDACHHVTLVLAVHTTSVRAAMKPVEEWVDPASLEGAFENATGEDVLVDFKVLNLPQDDPVLDALARGAGSFATLDAMRFYIDENFEKFVTPAPGCEEYLGLTVFGDVAQKGAFGGIGMYDVKRSHRIAFSLVSDTALVTDRTGEVQKALGRGDPSRTENWVNLLFAHEVGHTLGLHHPQHLTKADGSGPELNSFESVWSVMAYEQGDRNHDFGKMDQGQFVRNRAGFAVQEAQVLGLAEAAEFEAAVQHLAMRHWSQAHHALAPVLASAEADPEAAALLDYHLVDVHGHPWVQDLVGG